MQLGLLAVMVLLALNWNTLQDQYALATFHPAGDMASIEAQIGLTPKARAMFYRSSPRVDSKTTFNADCNTQPHELELGCYYRGRIYVLHIDNASLAPEMEVVTAHELLHAAWSRMSAADRAHYGKELEDYYESLHDKDLTARMQGYAQSEPGEQDNELHSILGTEYAGLPPDLEAHYAQYFATRGQIVAAHATYLAVFNTRRAELEHELAAIRSEKGSLAVLNQQLASYRAAGNISAYNALVPRQNRLVDDINGRIATYRQAVDEFNALSRSLDSQEITDTEVAAP
jgi:hypothetical protein